MPPRFDIRRQVCKIDRATRAGLVQKLLCRWRSPSDLQHTCCELPADGVQENIKTRSRSEHDTGQGRTETIIVAEDDRVVRFLAESILIQHGYQVLVAASGRECLQLAGKHSGPIHLLLADVVMPDMNGKELYRRLRASRPAMQGLYMSGYPRDVIARRGVLEDKTEFIQKPFSVAALADKVRAVLES